MQFLIVDDHRLFRDGLAMLLERMDSQAHIHQAADGAQALASFSAIDLDLVIVDYQLPDLNGIDLLQKMKAVQPALPVVVLSGHEDAGMIRQALSHGASGYIPKNLDPEEIINAIQLILEGGFYVPAFVIDQITQEKARGHDCSDLAHLAREARKLISARNSGGSEAGHPVDDIAKDLHRVLDVMEQEQDRLRQYAFYDSLTGLPNRRLFEDRLEQALKVSRRNQQAIALAALDLDRFKEINDTLGHDAGDALLQCIGERLAQAIREVDTAARLGGDEFMVVLVGVSDANAVHQAISRLFTQLIQPMDYKGQTLTPGVSIGVAISEATDSLKTLMKKSDTALYRAKAAGRNTFVIYD